MRNYEAAYYLLPNLEEAQIQTVNDKFSSQLSRWGGELVKLAAIGKKRLAYPIKNQAEGHFFVMEFKGGSRVAKALGRFLRISDEVLRAMIVLQN